MPRALINPFGVTDQEFLFVKTYFKLFGKPRAAMTAFLNAGYKHGRVGLGQAANRVVHRKRVRKLIKKMLSDAMKKTENENLDVVRELAIIGGSDIGRILPVVDGKVKIKNTEDLGAESRAIKSIEFGGDGKVRHVTLHDKNKALELLGDKDQLFTPRIGDDKGDENQGVLLYLPKKGSFRVTVTKGKA